MKRPTNEGRELLIGPVEWADGIGVGDLSKAFGTTHNLHDGENTWRSGSAFSREHAS